eukprot:11277090-Prorocentrum_lima.AAC.1
MPDAVPSGGPAEDPLPPPTLIKGYECSECQQTKLRDGFMPVLGLDGGAEKDWEGKVWGRCYPCSIGDGPQQWPSEEK